MKIFKRIVYSLLGLLIAGTVALVGVILYAEYSGKRFSPDSGMAKADELDEESRLAYDENGNLIELPGLQPSEETGGDSVTAESSPETAPQAPDAEMTAEPEAVPEDSAAPVIASAYASSGAEAEAQLPYVMDLGSALFHTPDCPYAANIASDKRSDMTTTSAKIMNAGYQPCTNCHPDTAAAAAPAGGDTVTVTNELGH